MQRLTTGTFPFIFALVFLAGSGVHAGTNQDPGLYSISASSTTAVVGGMPVVAVNLDIASGAQGLQGYGFGLCHDSAAVDIENNTDVAPGAALLALNPPAAFAMTAVFPGEGWTAGATIDFKAPEKTLIPGDLIFYTSLADRPWHVSVYLGKRYQASSVDVRGVVVEPLPSGLPYYVWVSGRRIIDPKWTPKKVIPAKAGTHPVRESEADGFPPSRE